MNEGSAAEPEPGAAHRSIYTKLLVAAAVGLLIWWALPGVPRDQTVIFALGDASRRVSRLVVDWERVGTEHVGHVTLNFPSVPATPANAGGTTSEPERRLAPDAGAGAERGTERESPHSNALQNSTPQNVVHHFRLADGEYSFRISARRTGVANERTEVTRQVTLNGNTLILRLEELTR